jgi:hypothetical protein
MSKLTLSIDPAVVAEAKRYAGEHGVSVSRLVQSYLSALAKPVPLRNEPPVLRSLRGTLKRAEPGDYRKHLSEKHR